MGDWYVIKLAHNCLYIEAPRLLLINQLGYLLKKVF